MNMFEMNVCSEFFFFTWFIVGASIEGLIFTFPGGGTSVEPRSGRRGRPGRRHGSAAAADAGSAGPAARPAPLLQRRQTAGAHHRQSTASGDSSLAADFFSSSVIIGFVVFG